MDFPGGRNRHGIAQPLGEFARGPACRKAPLVVLAYRSPNLWPGRNPPQLTGLSDGSIFTAFTVEGRMDPGRQGIRSAVSASVIP